MLVIRLARTGRKKFATYRIVAAEKRFTATGKFVEILGHYNPHTKELTLAKEALAKRVAQGAQPSNRVLKLMVQEGMELPQWAKIATKTSKPKKEPEAAAEPATAEVAAEAAEVAEGAAASDGTGEAEDDSAAQEVAAEAAAEASAAEAKSKA